ncbi:cytochrome P450 [Lentinula aciculospora]|uniref:Cytochrome P450 n=1 Tax=Lentinula aciculospora TaxID=153920 RepID=A0A9W8ZVT6_9AGAR|nr:cytochrome P450 [Lentinula aciculospora]KAJ4483669.1 cytochrome P450 [Lentinula aciculospora]
MVIAYLLSEIGTRVALLGVIAFAYFLHRRYTRISISHIHGPEPESFFLGNLPELFQSQVGVPDFKWKQQFGNIVRIKGAFGEDRLVVSDPKAMQYIFQTAGYGFLKWPERTEISRVLMGRGLLWADDVIHKRQRKAMLPGFGAPESRAFVPIFQKIASDLVARWNDLLASSVDQSIELNVASWLSRATMDSLGEAAFDYHFGALENKENELMKAYFGLMSDTLGQPSRRAIFTQTMMPVWYLQLMSKYSNSRRMVHARHTAELVNNVAQSLIDMKSEALLHGKENKDILSLLVKANASENPASRLTDEEMLAQMRTLLLAGHETSSTSLVWCILELSRHPEVQRQLREEIRATERKLNGREFTATDFDNMPYLSAVLKESMRFHPAVYQNYRMAAHDTVLPLSKPVTTTKGKMISELPIRKGTKLVLSIAAYNRNKEVFGEDADIFNPDRWFRSSERKGPTLGVYGNLLTFSGGVRACIGWRFALYEMQSLLVEIVKNFELGPTKELERLRREACLVMLPTLEGEEIKGENLPLRISIATRD